MRKHLSKALALTLAMSSLASVSLAEGSVLNVWCWNDEFQSRFNAYYPEVKEVAEDKSTTTLNDGTIVKWTINPNADNNYQNKLDEALLAQESAADDDKIDMFLIEADYALKYVDSPYTERKRCRRRCGSCRRSRRASCSPFRRPSRRPR